MTASFAALYGLVTSDPIMDPVVLELCRLRIATLLGCDVERQQRHAREGEAGLAERHVAELSRWTESDNFDERQRAALAYAEAFLIDAKDLSEEIHRLREVFTDAEVFALTVATGLFEGEQRRSLVLERLARSGQALRTSHR